jgi:hypothetical protein
MVVSSRSEPPVPTALPKGLPSKGLPRLRPAYWWSMIFSENRYLFGIML